MLRGQYVFASMTAALFLAAGNIIPALAQEEGTMVKPTSKGSLDIKLEPVSSDSTNITYHVSFLNPGTETLHQHQDYDFRILKDGEEIFSAAKQTNQPLIHNVEGEIFVPYNFSQTGEYTIDVLILGLGFGPTLVPTEENAVFEVVVTPEFPVTIIGLAAAMVGSIALTRKFKLF